MDHPIFDSDDVREMSGVVAGKTFGCLDVSSKMSDVCSSTLTLDPSLMRSSSLKKWCFYYKPFLVLLMV